MELYHLRSQDDPLTRVVKDDPVRPHIPMEQRINDAAEILLLKAGEEVLAATHSQRAVACWPQSNSVPML